MLAAAGALAGEAPLSGEEQGRPAQLALLKRNELINEHRSRFAVQALLRMMATATAVLITMKPDGLRVVEPSDVLPNLFGAVRGREVEE